MNQSFIQKLKNAASEKITKGEDFLYEGKEASIKWVELVEFLDGISEEKNNKETIIINNESSSFTDDIFKFV